ncbi:MAG: c-type cytochrome [Planctomycetes bacterium]|nr:c-type cytochrome [Planctomycetota bacterium]
MFTRTCLVCHSVANEGAKLGPPLDGSAHRGTEGLLRAIVTPSAAVESGYRLLLVETVVGEHLDGFLASQDEHAIVLRRPQREDLRVERGSIASLAFDTVSVMPLFAYLTSLR